MYDFRKIVRKKHTINFWNKHFQRDNLKNYHLIQRRNAKKAKSSDSEEDLLGISSNLKLEIERIPEISEFSKMLLLFKNKNLVSLR